MTAWPLVLGWFVAVGLLSKGVLAGDPASGIPGRHMAAIGGAVHLAVDPSGKRLFVGGPDAGQWIRGWRESSVSVTVISLGVGTGPAGGAIFSPDGERLFWADGHPGKVSVFRSRDGVREGVLQIRPEGDDGRQSIGRLGELGLSADGKILYAVDEGRRRILGIEVDGGRVVTELESTGGTIALWGGTNRVVGVDTGRGRHGGPSSLWWATVDATERLVMGGRWNGAALWKPGLGRAGGVDGFAIAGDSVYVSAADLDAVGRVDLESWTVCAWRTMAGRDGASASAGAAPRGLVVDSTRGRLYVAEPGWDAIGVYEATTLEPLGQLSTIGRPVRLVLEPGGGGLFCLNRVHPGLAGSSQDPGFPAESIVSWIAAPSAAELEAGRAALSERLGFTGFESRGAVASSPGPGTTNTVGIGEADDPSTRPLPAVRLPVEVLGLGGTREEIRVVLTGLEALRARTMCLTIHGLQYEDKARIRINDAYAISVNHRTVRILGNAERFGGIGGGFHTLPMEFDVPGGVLREGENLVVFEYTRQDSYAVSGFQLRDNRIDDASSGFRVLRLNLKDREGRSMLGSERFEDDDPESWAPPETSVEPAQAVRDGERLWRGLRADGTPYRLRSFSAIGLTEAEVRATCSDCHAQDGRDLKYYNYSNRSIVARSVIHGLTEEEGRRIAAYIRTLNGVPIVRRARPWNPPFQPGPGLDSRPVYEWAAGAGIDAVLEDTVPMYDAIHPGAVQRSASGGWVWDVSRITPDPILPGASLSLREIPIPLQLLDWNHWLPKVHPLDAYAGMMETNEVLRGLIAGFLKGYSNTVWRLRSPAGKTNLGWVVSFSHSSQAAMTLAREADAFDRRNHTLKEAQRRYPLMLLPMVKSWEFYMEHGLGDRVATATCGESADARSWRVGMLPFAASPNIAGLLDTREAGVEYAPRNGHGIGNNSALTFNYVSSAWYHLQVLLDHGNRNPQCGVNVAAPFDWPYVMAHLWELQGETAAGAGLSLMPMMYLYLAKSPQIYDTGLGVDHSQSGGWQPYMVMPYYLQHYSAGTAHYREMVWRGVTPEARGRLLETLYRVWLAKNRESTREKYLVPIFAHDPNSYLAYVAPGTQIGKGAFASLADRVHYVLTWKAGDFDGSLDGFGVSREFQDELIDWAEEIWPLNGDGTPGPWEDLRPGRRHP